MAGTVAVHGILLRHARARCGANCANAEKAFAYLGWYGTLHAFEIGSRRFAHAFMTANKNKLVNLSPEAKSLLSGRLHEVSGPTAVAAPQPPRVNAPARWRVRPSAPCVEGGRARRIGSAVVVAFLFRSSSGRPRLDFERNS
jgi:hypothetical protein